MQAEETKMILRYFGGIEAQLDDVNIELAELRDRYNPIKGIAMDGMPHGSTPGDSTASLAGMEPTRARVAGGEPGR